MTDERRAILARRAFPDGGVQPWRARMVLTVVAAVALVVVGQPFAAALMLATAGPTAIRFVRRELALGALWADAYRCERAAADVPLVNLREI